MHESYQNIKDDIKELQTKQTKLKESIGDLIVETKLTSGKITDLDKNQSILLNYTKNLDGKTGDTSELNANVQILKEKIQQNDISYGKVILILKELVAQKAKR